MIDACELQRNTHVDALQLPTPSRLFHTFHILPNPFPLHFRPAEDMCQTCACLFPAGSRLAAGASLLLEIEHMETVLVRERLRMKMEEEESVG